MKYPYLDKIQKNGDVKKLPQQELPLLCEDIRNFLIESVSSTGGHLSSNLGVVELTVALHRALTLPQDKILFDVGHQCYTHKLLTGRREGFAKLRDASDFQPLYGRASPICARWTAFRAFPPRRKATVIPLLRGTAARRFPPPSVWHAPKS